MLKPTASLAFRQQEVIWLTPSDKLETRFCILHDSDGAVTVDSFTTIVVVTLLDVTLAFVDP